MRYSIEPAAGNRHPHLHGTPERPRRQSDLLDDLVTVWHLRRNGVALAVVGEGVFVEGLQDDLHLLLKELEVRFGVEYRSAEGLDLPGLVAAADSEKHAALCEDVGHRVVFGKPKGMPVGDDVHG